MERLISLLKNFVTTFTYSDWPFFYMLGKSGNKKFSHRYSTNVTEPLPEPWNLRSFHEWKNHALEKTNKAHGRTAHDLPELKNEGIVRVKSLRKCAQVIDEEKPVLVLHQADC